MRGACNWAVNLGELATAFGLPFPDLRRRVGCRIIHLKTSVLLESRLAYLRNFWSRNSLVGSFPALQETLFEDEIGAYACAVPGSVRAGFLGRAEPQRTALSGLPDSQCLPQVGVQLDNSHRHGARASRP